jgi:DNA-binding transcriptional regulator GbsR (MarR family)
MNPPLDDLPPVVRRFVEDAGNATQSLGIGRVIGQIYAYLYFSPSARSLADLQRDLGISKGAASMGVRQLEQWSGVRKIWVKGDRKDYYEANDWLGKILKDALVDLVGRRLSSWNVLLAESEAETTSANGHDPDAEFVRQRVSNLCAFQNKLQNAWNNPVIRMLLK